MSLESFIRAIPKVELHVHLEGSFPKEALLPIAEQNDIPDTLKHYGQWTQMLDRPDYTRLDELAFTYSQWLQQPEDITRMVYELGVSLAKQNVRYAEVSVMPTLYMENGLTFEQFLGAINDGRDRVERGWQVQMVWILTIPRDQPRRADDLVRWVTSAAAKKGYVVGLGLSGKEDAQPVGQFERAFRNVEKKGIPRMPHAGDVRGAEGILESIQLLQPNRIYDGWGTADAPDVITQMLENQISLSVCMARELCLGRISGYSSYPLRDLCNQELLLTLGSDMPSFFKTTLTDEYLAAVEHCGLTVDEIETLALNGVRASALPDEEKNAMLKQFTDEYARLRAEHLAVEVKK
jgi:adenosine deaminase